MKAITVKDKAFAQKTADRINKSHPDAARVVKDVCMVTRVYYDKCCRYVLNHCNLKYPNKKDQNHETKNRKTVKEILSEKRKKSRQKAPATKR